MSTRLIVSVLFAKEQLTHIGIIRNNDVFLFNAKPEWCNDSLG